MKNADRHEAVFHRSKEPDTLDKAAGATAQAAWCMKAAGEHALAPQYQMDAGRLRLYAARFARLDIWSNHKQAVARIRKVVDALLPHHHPAAFGCLPQLALTLSVTGRR
ncbi:hypothetical protein ABZY20_34435 [Streptomyces sp. NPDC006624]|uniref:hypothetical protein n=1 Tax=Streptomyces sp. NPDC006624 TaxID=3154892 RepID=UPI0033BEA0F5